MDLQEDFIYKIREALEAGRYHAQETLSKPSQEKMRQEAIQDSRLLESVLHEIDSMV